MKKLLNSFPFSNSLKSLFGKKKAQVKPVDLPDLYVREAMLDEMIREAIKVRPAPKIAPRQPQRPTPEQWKRHCETISHSNARYEKSVAKDADARRTHDNDTAVSASAHHINMSFEPGLHRQCALSQLAQDQDADQSSCSRSDAADTSSQSDTYSSAGE